MTFIHLIPTLLCTLTLYFLAITVSFNQTVYSVTEHNGSVQAMLVLSSPSPCHITVHVKVEDITAISKLRIKRNLCRIVSTYTNFSKYVATYILFITICYHCNVHGANAMLFYVQLSCNLVKS